MKLRSLIIVCLGTVLLNACAISGSEKQVTVSSCTGINYDDLVESCYREKVHKKISAHWRLVQAKLIATDRPKNYQVRARVAIKNNGHIAKIHFEKVTANRQLNRSVIEALHAASPLPVPPEPYFSKGGFNQMFFQFVEHDIPPVISQEEIAEMRAWIGGSLAKISGEKSVR
ncbi:MAG: TonB C-terminal domain-containing protein [Gammaproteobacteria bacterium]|nr:TonB C-terminal domain-containing protein [Gammaproteobacteria bacterium]MDH5730468.1 TonB C-terminal domain-containing protein [Gammaproteobacteria bacterium]